MSKAMELDISLVDELDGEGCMNLMDALITNCFTIPLTSFKENYKIKKAYAENSPALEFWCTINGYSKKRVEEAIIDFNKKLMEYSNEKISELKKKQRMAIFLEYLK